MDRRNFMKAGLASSSLLLLPTLLTSCDIVDTKESNSDTAGDIKLLTSAVLMEGSAIKTYEAALTVISTQQNKNVANAFKDHHTQHAEAMNNVLKKLGASTADYTKSVADSNVSRVDSELKALELATAFELIAAQAYFSFSAGSLVSAQAKSVFADILPAELAHYSFLRYARGLPSSESIAFLSTIQSTALSF